jgi:hypothetical protein
MNSIVRLFWLAAAAISALLLIQYLDATSSIIIIAGGFCITIAERNKRVSTFATYAAAAVGVLTYAAGAGTITTLNPAKITLLELAATLAAVTFGVILTAIFHTSLHIFLKEENNV